MYQLHWSRYFLVVTLYVCVNWAWGVSANEFTPKETALLLKIKSDPKAVIEEILPRLAPMKSRIEPTQLQFVLSQAYIALVLPEQALEHAQKGLALVPPDEVTLISHYLQLAVTMRVMESAGRASRKNAATLNVLSSRADKALYAAKETGRDRTVIFSPKESSGC